MNVYGLIAGCMFILVGTHVAYSQVDQSDNANKSLREQYARYARWDGQSHSDMAATWRELKRRTTPEFVRDALESETDPAVQAVLLYLASDMGIKQVRQEVADLLESDNRSVLREALRYLAAYGDDGDVSAVRSLIQRARNDPFVLYAATDAVSIMLPLKAAIRELQGIAKDIDLEKSIESVNRRIVTLEELENSVNPEQVLAGILVGGASYSDARWAASYMTRWYRASSLAREKVRLRYEQGEVTWPERRLLCLETIAELGGSLSDDERASLRAVGSKHGADGVGEGSKNSSE